MLLSKEKALFDKSIPALARTIGRLGSKRQFLDVDQKILLVYDDI